ncbi:ammonium transporter [Allonocardiopsis opalescens]|uniref:Ammonium transporter n=1 Tax=Allonocardiopsis opalescens TaxID=1144618 RepID=A0A2T0PW24_9ACTN|nr:ammonium transporter [Allonocardiopsis opalescens]PRX95630.1 ammonium transporter [Allonocardiopsis opalescens]
MEIDSGSTAWVLTCAALVMLMTPGLAFFYGGMSRAKSVLNMMMMSLGSIAVISVLWVLVGYSLTFGSGSGPLSPIIGGLDTVGLTSILTGENNAIEGLPDMAFAAFQMMFAIITVALISGAIADRARFGAWMVFAPVWALLVYFPIAHWVWSADGWIFNLGAIDFAGGTAVHINAGAAALAVALVVGRRKGFGTDDGFRPHNLPFVLLGAALLWFGWFGFNAGSAVAANTTASIAFVNTQVATAAAAGAWMLVERLRFKGATSLGFASGAVAGLVAITPAASTLDPIGSIILGLIAGAVCSFAVSLKYRLGFDDSLDVVGIHLVAGVIGSIAIGFLATGAVTSVTMAEETNGLFFGGGLSVLITQVIAVVAVLLYSFVASFIIAKVIDMVMGFRVREEVEVDGIDQVHNESAYEFTGMHGTGAFGAETPASSNGTAPGEPVKTEQKVEA